MARKSSQPSQAVESPSASRSSGKKLTRNFEILDLAWNAKQKQLIKILRDKDVKCVILKGPAGTSKTILAVYAALHLLSSSRINDIVYIRPAVESASHSLGHLPGTVDDKLGPYMEPFRDKLDELLKKPIIEALEASGSVHTYAINFLRGLHFANKAIIVDEAQSASLRDLVTVMTRVGEGSRLFICGDPMQSDIKVGAKDGFSKLWTTFSDEASLDAGVVTFEFDEDDIVRSEFVKFVIKKLRSAKLTEAM